MKKIILSILCIYLVQLAIAQQKSADQPAGKKGLMTAVLSGYVTDSTNGKPLPSASVYLVDDKIGAITDDKGFFQLKNITTGHHVLEVTYAGYSSVVEHIDLQENTSFNIKLSSVIIENQEVIVTGVANATSRRRSTVPVAVMRKADLLQTVSSNIVDAMSKTPGIAQISSGQAISKPVIRGLGYNRVVVMNDGVRQEGQQWGDEHGLEIDELSVGKVEILKGPSSLMYGSDAMAGVINLITHTPLPDGSLKGNIITNYQSNAGLFSMNANLAGSQGGWNWNVYGSGKSAGDYRNKWDGRVLNSRFNEKNGGGYIGVNRKWGYSHLIFSHFNQNIGIVEGERDGNTGDFILYGGTPDERIATHDDLKSRSLLIPRQHVVHNKIISDNSFNAGRSRIKVNLGIQQNIRKEYGEPEHADEESLHFDLRTFNYNVQWRLPEMREWHSTVGISGMRQENFNKGEEVLIPEYNLFDIGAFVHTQRFHGKTTYSGGLRFDSRTVNSSELKEGSDIRFEDFSRRFSNISGSAGVSHEAGKNTVLKLNLARGFRAPTLAELASNGAHEGSNRYEYGTQNLKSETSMQLDAGIEIGSEHFHIGLNAFYNRIRNFIFYRKLESLSGGDSLVHVDGEDLMAFQFNQQHAKLPGFELMIDLHPHPLDWLHFENSLSYVRGTFDRQIEPGTSGSNNLPLIPAFRWNSELRGDFKKSGKSLRNVYTRLQVVTTFRQNRPFEGFGTETATPGYTLVNAGAGADIVKKDRTIFSVYLGASNLLDAAYQSHLSRLKYTDENQATGRTGVFNTGRNFSVRLNVPLDFRK